MTFAAHLILSASVLAAGASIASAQPASAPAIAAAPAAQQSAHDRLFQLFKDSDEASLKRNQLNALFRGDLRYADHFGDFITDEYYAGEKAAAEADLAALAAIPRGDLNATDQLAYDVFKYQRENDLKDVSPEMLALTAVRPINHFSGFHTFYPVFASGRNAAIRPIGSAHSSITYIT